MRAAEDAFPEVRDWFDPPLYTDEELVFIKEHLGETAYIALQTADDESPAFRVAQESDARTLASPVRSRKGNKQDRPTALKSMQNTCGSALQRFHELAEISQHRKEPWVVRNPSTGKETEGFDGVKQHIDRWLRRQQLYQERKANDPKGFGFHPEQWTIKGGVPVWSGKGTHCERVRYPLQLVAMGQRSYDDFTTEAYREEDDAAAEVAKVDAAVELVEQVVDGELPTDTLKGDRFFTCPVDGCGHRSEFDPESQMSENRALNGLRVHMGRPKGKFKTDEHAELKGQIAW